MNYILVVLADIANGLLAVLAASWLYSVDPQWWYFLIGIALAMSPDLDGVRELVRRGRVSASAEHTADHRDGLHYPVLWLVVGSVATYYLSYWGAVFLFATLLHFLNDFYGTGWGIKLLWPLSQRNYKLLGRRANLLKSILIEKGMWEQLSQDERKLLVIVSWSPQELPDYIHRYGLDKWIEPYYLKLNWINVVEYSLFLIAATLTLMTLLY
ncbi:MAG: metal-dependent hydrolase [Patescibacteria group bacterium]